MTIARGTRFGPYEIGRPIGAGGMGEVYEASDTRLRRTVAVKVISGPPDPTRDRELEREARAVARLNHANICVLHDVGQQNGQFFFVMERLSGETLAERLERGPLPLEQALDHAVAIADAMDAAHRAGILHRDLKPANVMLTKAGPKLLDFGLAARATSSEILSRDATVTSDSSLPAAPSFAGTLRYMAPELLEGRPADQRSDVFAFGALLYEMLAGRPAFGGDTQAAIVSAIMGTEPPPLQGLPAPLDRLVRRCLAKDPEDRWQTARDLHEALLLVRGSADARPAGSRRASMRWLVPLAIVAIGVVAVAGARRWWARPATSSTTPVIVLMDSPVPERVYDPATRKAGGTNADDISDVLRDLPVEVHKETTSALWHREDEVVKQRPSLVMMHLSSFAEPAADHAASLQPNAQERTRSFLGYVALAEPYTKFIVYSRGFATDAERAAWVDETEIRFPALHGRLQLMHVPGEELATFRNPQTARAVHDAVKALLKL
jgi:hypothetical protein